MQERNSHEYGTGSLSTGVSFVPTRQAGFTLIELLTAFFISMALFTILVVLFLRVGDFKQRTERVVNGVRTAAGVFKLLRRDLEGAYAAGIADGGQMHFETDAGTGNHGMRFWTATENRFGNPSLEPGTQSHEVLQVTYKLVDGGLYRKTWRQDLNNLPVEPERPRYLVARGIYAFKIATLSGNTFVAPLPDMPPPRAIRLMLTLYMDRGADTNGDGLIEDAERIEFLDGRGGVADGTIDPSEELTGLQDGRLRRFSETINIPAGGL